MKQSAATRLNLLAMSVPHDPTARLPIQTSARRISTLVVRRMWPAMQDFLCSVASSGMTCQNLAVEVEELCDSAVRILRECGMNAAVSDTGGRVICITVSQADAPLDEPRFTFGIAGETWAAEVDGITEGLSTNVSSKEENPAEVASGIIEAIGRFSQGQQ